MMVSLYILLAAYLLIWAVAAGYIHRDIPRATWASAIEIGFWWPLLLIFIAVLGLSKCLKGFGR